jgi:hypothetical protein
MLRPTNTVISVSTHAIIFLVFLSLGFAYYSSASEATSTEVTEDIEAQDISTLIQSASQYVNETEKAIESGNSTEALELLALIRAELNNINGNITELIFSVSQTPP